MISPSRYEELHGLFWDETNEEWTREWRDELTPEEADMVILWDQQAHSSMLKMCLNIVV